MKLKEIMEQSIQLLKQQGIPDACLKEKMLIASLLKVPKEYLILNEMQEIPEEIYQKEQQGVQRLIQGEPIQYIIQHQEFMKLDFFVNEDVLIPQPDTEILVEEVLGLCKKEKIDTILDMGTGSGAISICLAYYLPKVNIVAVDISPKALAVAKKNAINNKVEQQIQFVQSDMFHHITNTYDIIVSNPPYIQTQVLETLEPEVQREPKLALDGGQDGLNYYRILIQEAPKYLKKQGYLAFEIGYDQAQEVAQLLTQSKKYTQIQIKQDLAGKNRVILAKVR